MLAWAIRMDARVERRRIAGLGKLQTACFSLHYANFLCPPLPRRRRPHARPSRTHRRPGGRASFSPSRSDQEAAALKEG